jgi:hypothetical protein
MPVSRYSRRLGLERKNLFVPGGDEELRQIARNYLTSSEKREADRHAEKRIEDWTELAKRGPGCGDKLTSRGYDK